MKFLIDAQLPRGLCRWLRCSNATNRALAEWLEARWTRVEELLEGGERMIELV